MAGKHLLAVNLASHAVILTMASSGSALPAPTPAFTCKARLNDCSRSEHTSAPCLVQGLVVRLSGRWSLRHR